LKKKITEIDKYGLNLNDFEIPENIKLNIDIYNDKVNKLII
jgi:hypothetical protein